MSHQAPRGARCDSACTTRERGRVLVVGHRGAMGYCPENTLPSFERALALGADCDRVGRAPVARRRADRHPRRNGRPHHQRPRPGARAHPGRAEAARRGRVVQPRYMGERIPTLDEVLAWANAREMAVDIEIKNGPHLLRRHRRQGRRRAFDAPVMTDQAIVISFDHRAVERVKELDPHCALGVLYAARPADGGVGLAQAANAEPCCRTWAYVTGARTSNAAHDGRPVRSRRGRPPTPSASRELIAGWRRRRSCTQSPGRRASAPAGTVQ